MQKAELTKRIAETGAMAIVRVETIERGIEIANGCLDGGVTCLEISYTLPNAGEVIQALREKFQDRLIIGAGTVLDSETARHAILHNAQFIIAPNFSQEVAVMCTGTATRPSTNSPKTSLLQYIEWTPGRTGEIAPVAVFTPVEIDGCEVSRARDRKSVV